MCSGNPSSEEIHDRTGNQKVTSTADAPLKGLKVVELARILAGPWIGQTLADLGAEVIKIESPEGDDTRYWGPPFIEREDGKGGIEKVAAYFHCANRGKTSVVCDFNNPEDLAKLKALISEADVLIENFKLGGLAKYGLDYNSVKKSNSGLIYASLTGFGQTGPRATQPGYDYLLQAMTGIMDLTGEPDAEPQKIGVAWIDIFTGLYGVIGIQAALAARWSTGCGQHIDLSLFDTGLAVLANQASSHLLGGLNPTRMGNAHPSIVPYQVFNAANGHLVIACGNDRQFKALCKVLGQPELASDDLFIRNSERVIHRQLLVPKLSQLIAAWDKSELIDALENAGVPAGPINSVADALNDPQVAARGLRIAPEGFPGLRSPLIFSENALQLDKAAPTLGDGAWHFQTAEMIKDTT